MVRKRQLDDYYSKFYNNLRDRSNELKAEGNKLAIEIANWKESVAEKWDDIKVVSIKKADEVLNGNMKSGEEYNIEIVVDEAGLNDVVGIELVTLITDKDGVDHVYNIDQFKMVSKEGNLFTFKATHSIDNAGSFKVCYRMYPKNEHLPHRQDFCYVKWFI